MLIHVHVCIMQRTPLPVYGDEVWLAECDVVLLVVDDEGVLSGPSLHSTIYLLPKPLLLHTF